MKCSLRLFIFFVTLSLNTAEATELGSAYSAAQINDLNQALVSTYETNPEIKRARAELESVSELQPQAFSGFLPNVGANLDYGHQSTEIGDIETSGKLFNKSIQAIQPIYRGGNFSRLGQADYLAHGAMYNLQNTEQEVFLSAISAYVGLITDQSLVELSRNQEDLLYKQYDETKRRFKVGELTRTDLTQAISRYSSANSQSQIAASNLENSTAAFQRIIGAQPGNIQLPTNLPQIPNSFDEALAEAKLHNPAIISSKYLENASLQAVDANEGRLEPNLSLQARAENDQNYGVTDGSDYTNNSITLNLNIPLYQGGEEYSRVRQAKADASARRFQYMSAVNRVTDDTQSVWKRIFTTTQAIEANELAVQSASIALAGVKKEEQAGLRTVIDILDAEQELYAAKSRLLLTKRDQLVAYYTLLARIGRLTAKDLNLPVNYYDPEKYYADTKYKFIGF